MARPDRDPAAAARPDRDPAPACLGLERAPARTGQLPMTGWDPGRPLPARTAGHEVPGPRAPAPVTAAFRPAPLAQTRTTGAAPLPPPGPARMTGPEPPDPPPLALATAAAQHRPPGLAQKAAPAPPGLPGSARMAGPEHTGPRPPARAMRPPPALAGPAQTVTRSHPVAPALPAHPPGPEPPGHPATARTTGRSHLAPQRTAQATERSRPGPQLAAQATGRSHPAPPDSVRATGEVPRRLPVSARQGRPGLPRHREPAQVAVAGPPSPLEAPSAGAGGLERPRPGAAAEGCGDRFGVTHRRQAKPTRCIRPDSSRHGTGHPPGPPGWALTGLAAPLASRKPSRGTPRSPSATRPRTRRRPRPGRPLTTGSCRTGGRRDEPAVTGSHTQATPARCAGRRPVLGRWAQVGRRTPSSRRAWAARPPPLDGPPPPAARLGGTAGAPARLRPQDRDGGSEGSRRPELHPPGLRSPGPHSSPDRRSPHSWGPDRASPPHRGPHGGSPRSRSRSCRGLPTGRDPHWAHGRHRRAAAKPKSSSAPVPRPAAGPGPRAAGRANRTGRAAEPRPASDTTSR